MRSETRKGLIRLGLREGEWAAFLAPVVGLLVFWLLPFKSAVTLYVLIAGLGIVFLKVVELRQFSLEIEEIMRRTRRSAPIRMARASAALEVR